MRIRWMQATFGRLKGQRLELQPGLNLITGENEAGKSTWAEFLMAMLYGVETRSRSRGQELPVKTRYAPWSGAPMAGSMELDWQGRSVLLERTSELSPMGSFSARDPDSGSPIPELTGNRCGQVLLGVEAGVYQRSAFLRQRRPAVTADPQLEKRLSGLVTAGTEDYAYGEIDGGLRKLQTALWYHQTGALPRAREALEEKRQALADMEARLEKRSRLAAALRDREAELQELTRIREGLDRLEQRSLFLAAAECSQALDQARAERSAREAACEGLPEPQTVAPLRTRLRELREQLEAAAMEEAMDPIALPELPEDPRFAGLTTQQIREQTQAHAAQIRQAQELPALSAHTYGLIRSQIPGLAALLLSLALFHWLPFPGSGILAWVLLGLGAGWILWAVLRHWRTVTREQKAKSQARELLQHYGVESAYQVIQAGAEFVRQLESLRKVREEAERALEARRDRIRNLTEERQALLDRLQALGAEAADPDQAEAWFVRADQARLELEQAQRREYRCRSQLERLQRHLPEAPPPETEPEAYADYDPAVIRDRLSRCTEAIRSLRTEADRLDGAIAQAGDPLVLHAEAAALEAEIRRLETRYSALELARAALEQADTEIRSRFAPLLCARAGELFSELTEGQYDRVRLDRDLRVTVHPAGSSTDRPLGYLSGGTADQLYLAIRLAICDLLLPQAPIVLDDALVFFDDHRAALALKLLRRLARDRQILIFTCQSRERRLLDRLAAESAPET